LLNIIAGTLSAGTPPIPPTSYESIATYTVGGTNQTSITFSSIPSTFKHLQIRGIGRFAGGDAYSSIEFNGVTPSNKYYRHALAGSGAVAVAQEGADTTALLQMTNDSKIANNYAAFIVDILDYTSTAKNKTVRGFSAFDNNGSGLMFFESSLWSSTPAAINSIKFDAQAYGSTSSFTQYTQFALYGIKGA
jgi:hypothetical protein